MSPLVGTDTNRGSTAWFHPGAARRGSILGLGSVQQQAPFHTLSGVSFAAASPMGAGHRPPPAPMPPPPPPPPPAAGASPPPAAAAAAAAPTTAPAAVAAAVPTTAPAAAAAAAPNGGAGAATPTAAVTTISTAAAAASFEEELEALASGVSTPTAHTARRAAAAVDDLARKISTPLEGASRRGSAALQAAAAAPQAAGAPAAPPLTKESSLSPAAAQRLELQPAVVPGTPKAAAATKPTTAATATPLARAATIGLASGAASMGASTTPKAAAAGAGSVLTLPPSTDPLSSRPGSLVFELELWRADLLSGVVEVDGRGRVGKQDVHPLSPAALVLGASPKQMAGQDLAQLLPLPPGGVMALLNGRSGGGARGGLKSKPKSLGAPMDLTAMHHGDRCELALRVQAVKRSGAPGAYYVLVRQANFTPAQPAFKRYLFHGDDSGLMTQQPGAGSPVGSRLPTDLGFLKPGARGPSGTAPRHATDQGLGRAFTQPGVAHRSATDLGYYGARPAPQRSSSLNLKEPSPQYPQPHSSSSPQLPGQVLDAALAAAAAPANALQQAASLPTPPNLGSIGQMRVARKQPSRFSTTEVPAATAADATPPAAKSPADATLSSGAEAAAASAGEGDGGASRLSSESDRKLPSPGVAAVIAGEQGGTRSPRGSASLLKILEHGDTEDDMAIHTHAPPAAAGAAPPGKESRIQDWLLSAGWEDGPRKPQEERGASGSADGASDGGGGSSEGKEEDRQLSSDEEREVRRRTARDPNGGGGEGESASNAEDAQAMDEAGSYVTNFKDGKRFKKLLKLLTSPAALAPTTKLRLHTLIVIAMLLVAHTATFVVILTAINDQKAAVEDLNSVAMASRKVHEIAINNRVMDAMYGGEYVADLDLWNDTQAGIEVTREDQVIKMQELKALHHGVYLGFRKERRLPTDYGLRDLWEKPSFDMAVYYDFNDPATGELAINASGDEPSATVKVSLWDGGNLILAKSLDVYQLAPELVARGVNFTSLAGYRFIRANALPVIFPAYKTTLDAMVQITISESDRIANVQLIMLVIEGCCLCIAACLYMWYIAQQHSHHRHKLYFIFVLVPIGLTNSLASKPLGLEEGDDEDEAPVTTGAQQQLEEPADEGQQQQGAGAAGHKDGGGGPKEKKGLSFATAGRTSERRASADGTATHGEGGELQKAAGALGSRSVSMPGAAAAGGAAGGQSMLSALAFWRSRAKVKPSGGAAAGAAAGKACSGKYCHGKRQLVVSYRSSVLLVLPFILWGALIISISAAAHHALRAMSGPIATLNVVNFVLVKHHRLFNYAAEVCAATNPGNRAYYKEVLAAEYAGMRMEYNAMLFGSEAVPGETSPHFRLARGVLFTGGTKPADLLYHHAECMAENPEDCQPEGSSFYLVTRNGLDVLLKRYFNAIESLLVQSDAASTLNSSEWHFIWSTGQRDIEGSLATMSQLFLTEVLNSYSVIMTEQIIMFALAWVLAVLFIVLQLRPFVARAANEMRRVAELLCQLPQEVDVEGMVMKHVIALPAPPLPKRPVAPLPDRNGAAGKGTDVGDVALAAKHQMLQDRKMSRSFAA